METTNRREFLQDAAGKTLTLAAGATMLSQASRSYGADANDKIVLAIVGTKGRGCELIKDFYKNENIEIAYLCDPDDNSLAKAANVCAGKQSSDPKQVKDFRVALEDKAVDAIVVATPNHWHAPATIMGCNAGKHVYVEKPCCHNPQEGEWMVQSARKHKRVVVMGTQRRSSPVFMESVQKLREGIIGDVHYARSWYNNARPSIGHGKLAEVPKWLDYSLWQGPAPELPYKDNYLHYNWHWFWHWGNGELGNNGVHSLDVCRWALGVDYPTRVVSTGGKYRHDDDQETPDTNVVTFDFPGKSISWEGLSWSPMGPRDGGFGVSFHGDKGTMLIAGTKCIIYDMKNKELSSTPGAMSAADHQKSFLNAIRNGGTPNAEIEEGYKSTLLTLLGNISYRTGRAINVDPKNGHIIGDADAQKLWGREYRKGWEPVV